MFTLQHNVDLLPYNTFKVSCLAKRFVVVQSVTQLQALVHSSVWRNIKKRLILGGGSNMLLVSPTYEGLVIKNEIPGIEVSKETEEIALLRVGAGVVRDDLVQYTIDAGYIGLENLISIPGTVGASPVQNIGAYGVEVSSSIVSVECVDTMTGEFLVLDAAVCEFGYRSSIFKTTKKGKYIITQVLFELKKYDPATYQPVINYGAVVDRLGDQTPTPRLVADTIAQIRSEKLPDWRQIGTAGSFFKNPYVIEEKFLELQEKFGVKGWKVKEKAESRKQNREGNSENINNINSKDLRLKTNDLSYKLSAGQLIDLAGLKGYRVGNIGVYDQHALVLVNYGETDGSKFVGLIRTIQEKIDEMFGVRLEPEVNVL